MTETAAAPFAPAAAEAMLKREIVRQAAVVRASSDLPIHETVRRVRWATLVGILIGAQAYLGSQGTDWSQAEILRWAGVTDGQALLSKTYPTPTTR